MKCEKKIEWSVECGVGVGVGVAWREEEGGGGRGELEVWGRVRMTD